jgi:hypothetical protein
MRAALRRCFARFLALDIVDTGSNQRRCVRLEGQAATVRDLEWLDGLGR